MKKLATLRSTVLFLGLFLLILVSCDSFDDLPAPILTRYDLPPEVLEMVFTNDIPRDMRNVDNFLDKIKQHGMFIYEGSSPPFIFDYSGNLGSRFNIGNYCIYDGSNSKNKGFSYGEYMESIRIFVDPIDQSNILADVSYVSISNPDYPEFPRGLDSGSGTGYVSGEGENFTIFLKVINGKYDEISYSAIWIISGTYSNLSEENKLTNVTKCMIMLQRGEDRDDMVAKRGTVRIFRDDDAEWIPG